MDLLKKQNEISHAKNMCNKYPDRCYSYLLLYEALKETDEAWNWKKFYAKLKTCVDFKHYYDIAKTEIKKETSSNKKGFAKAALGKFGGFMTTFLSLLFSLIGFLLLLALPELILIPVIVVVVFFLVIFVYSCIQNIKMKNKILWRLIKLIKEDKYALLLVNDKLF